MRRKENPSGNRRSGARHENIYGAPLPGRRQSPLPDYGQYHLSRREKVMLTGIGILLDGMIAYLFYRSFLALIVFSPIVFLVVRSGRNMLAQQRFSQMRSSFLNGMELVCMSLQTGYAVENAFREALTELKRLYDPDAYIVVEFSHIVKQLSLNQTIEFLLADLAARSHIEEISSFSEVFSAAKRTGGDLIAVIRNTVTSMQQKDETLKEIETVLAGKKMEQKIMCLMPMLMLAYVGLTSPEFLESMYHSGPGILVMTVCLAVYGSAVWWSGRIMDIQM